MDEDLKTTTTTKPARRLCSEIQLFDLCDLESCNSRAERFCTNSELLSKFDQIAEEDMSCPTEQYLAEETDESESDDEYGYGDEFSGGDYDDEDGREE